VTSASAVRRPGRPRSEEADRAILDATADLLASHGYAGLTVEAVASRSGVAKSTIYRRWPGKDELVLDAINAIKGPITEILPGSVRDQLLYLAERVRVSWFDTRMGRLMSRLAAEGVEQPEVYRSFRDKIVAPRQAVMRSVLERGVHEGLIRDDVPLQAVIDLIVSPVVAAALTHRGKVTREQMVFVIDTVLAGCARRAG
jgi:AcrR family transcriptional regulator